MKLSMLQLVDLTGFAQRTVKKRLADLTPEVRGKAHLYDSTVALPLLYGIGDPDGDRLDPQQERARLDVARRQLAELEHAKRSGDLIDATEVLARWTHIATVVKARMLAIPHKAAAMAEHRPATEVAEVLRVEIKAALTELADNDFKPDAPQ